VVFFGALTEALEVVEIISVSVWSAKESGFGPAAISSLGCSLLAIFLEMFAQYEASKDEEKVEGMTKVIMTDL